MTVTNVVKDAPTLSLTLDAEFDATPERVWQLWADPRQLERWWGPPTYPATFESLDLTSGGHAVYHLTGPTGDMPRAGWKIVEANPPSTIILKDQLADESGRPDPDFPIIGMQVNIQAIGAGRTRMTIRSEFPSIEALEKMLAMGMEQGLTEAVGQIDAILMEKVLA